ncbi:MAG: GGDEF domain-containing protein [Anaerolineales bacterium]
MSFAVANSLIPSLTNAIIPTVLAIAMWDYRQTRKTYPGFDKWALAFLVFGIGFLFIDLRGWIPDLFSVVIGNCLLIYAMLLINSGINLFFEKTDTTKNTLSFIFIVYIILQTFFTFINPNINARIVITSSFLTAVSIPAGLTLYNQALISTIRTSKSAGITLFITALINISRVVYALTSKTQINIQSDFFITLQSLVFTAIITALSIYFFFLNSARIESNLEIAHQKMIEIANTDPLTGLYNRRHFYENAQQEFQRAKRYNLALSVLIVDLDIFKQVNDKYGHSVGDQVLIHASGVFKMLIRSFDLLARFGGDEFVILLKETNEKQAQVVAERIRFFMEENPAKHNEKAVPMYLSIGLTSLTLEDTDVSSLMQRADKALYKAKELGRNRVVVTIEDSLPT